MSKTVKIMSVFAILLPVVAGAKVVKSTGLRKDKSELNQVVESTFQETNKLEKSYHEKLLAEKARLRSTKKKVINDVPVELGSDVMDLDYKPAADSQIIED